MNQHAIKVLAACAFALQALVSPFAWSASSVPVLDEIGTPRFTKQGGAVPLPGSRTIPYFTFSQLDPTNHVTYPITFVGAPPLSETTTVVPTVIIPLKLRFDNGVVVDGTARAAQAVVSPIFASFDYSVIGIPDQGQYGDVFMRAQANKLGSGYHVMLGAPTVLDTVTLDVPKNQGFGAISRATGAFLGLVDIVWFSSRLQNLITSLQIDSTALPMFISDNVFLYDGNDPGNCCVLGYHGAGHPTGYGSGNVGSNGNAPIQTFVWASLSTQGLFRSQFIADIHALSHEVAEWLDDPFITNYVQPWLTPTAPQYGCTPVLETGDPVVGIGFLLGGVWHPEDEVFWQWFLRETPSSAFGQRYTFMGPFNPYPGFHTAATGC
jgi:hypothetical protein